MPIFEYCCRKCSHRFETIVLSSREKIACPKCQSSSLEKQLSVFAAPASASDGASANSSGGCACTPQTCGCH